jgi:hypothetical protein
MSDGFEDRRHGLVSEAEIAMLFQRRAARADESGLAASIVAAVSDARQAGAWRTLLGEPFVSLPPLVRIGALVMAAVLAITVAFAAVGTGRPPRDVTRPTDVIRPPSGPTGTIDYLIRRFEYTVPGDTKLPGPARFGSTIVEWTSGSAPRVDPETVAPNAVGVQRGIVIASADTPWSHGPAGRTRLRGAPADLLTDLQEIAFVPLGTISETMLDGRPALVVAVIPPGANDLHFSAQMTGLTGEDFVSLSIPSRLTVADIDGATMLIDVWARTPDDLMRWLPTADEFIRSIHFLAPDETPAAS